MILNCKDFGFVKETEVSHNGRRLVTQGLDVETLCDLWKWYFNIPICEKISLIVNKKLFYAAEQSPLSSVKSVKELFKEQGVELTYEEAEE